MLFNGDVGNSPLAYDAYEAQNELERLFHPANYKREACQNMAHCQFRLHDSMVPGAQPPTDYFACPYYHDG